MFFDEPDDRRGFLKYTHSSEEPSPICRRRRHELGKGTAERPVRLVLLLLVGPREGENDVLECASVEEAVARGRQLYGEPQFQLEGIEDANGKSLIGYEHLNDLCCAPHSMQQRRRLP